MDTVRHAQCSRASISPGTLKLHQIPSSVAQSSKLVVKVKASVSDGLGCHLKRWQLLVSDATMGQCWDTF